MYSHNKVKIIASLMSAFILLVVIAVIASTNISNDLLKERIENQFLSESFGRGEAIRSLLDMYSNQVNEMAYRLSNDAMVENILLADEKEKYRYLSSYGYNNLSILAQKVREYGITFDSSTNIEDVFIMDRNGTVLLSSSNSLDRLQKKVPNPFSYGNPYSNAATNQDIVKLELKKVNGENRQLVEFTMPFVKWQQQPMSKKEIPDDNSSSFIISATLDTDSFNNILLNRKGLGDSGEVYMVNSSKMMVSESRFLNNTNPITVDTLPVRQCFANVNGGDASGIYNDYRNIPIVGFSYCAKDLGFVLMAEIDKSEVMQPIDDLRNTMILVSVLSGFILMVISIVVIQALLSWNKKLESVNRQLQNQDKMQREFINVAAHELKTPIQPILGLAEHLRERTEDKDQIHSLDIVIRNAKRLKKLSDDILDVAKIESNSLTINKETFSLDGLIKGIIQDFENGFRDNGIKFEYHGPNNVHSVFADRNRIRQVISNLIGNSVKFINKNGTVTISIEKNKSILDGVAHKKDTVILSVKDTGSGIDAEMLPKLFTKFASKSFQGTGLGLYISKKIVEAHGGKMWAKNNNIENGATFYFSLPLEN